MYPTTLRLQCSVDHNLFNYSKIQSHQINNHIYTIYWAQSKIDFRIQKPIELIMKIESTTHAYNMFKLNHSQWLIFLVTLLVSITIPWLENRPEAAIGKVSRNYNAQLHFNVSFKCAFYFIHSVVRVLVRINDPNIGAEFQQKWKEYGFIALGLFITEPITQMISFHFMKWRMLESDGGFVVWVLYFHIMLNRLEIIPIFAPI